eukprot:superscaffoldBa00006937_g22049
MLFVAGPLPGLLKGLAIAGLQPNLQSSSSRSVALQSDFCHLPCTLVALPSDFTCLSCLLVTLPSDFCLLSCTRSPSRVASAIAPALWLPIRDLFLCHCSAPKLLGTAWTWDSLLGLCLCLAQGPST